jgi:DNA-binding MarR family transcriptional regulator
MSVRGRAWRAVLEVHRDVVQHLERDFRESVGLDLLYYDVLLHVSEGQRGRRMTELADAVVLSKSGLTSVVDRMEADGLLERRPDPDDRRAVRVVLTPRGEERFREAAEQHAETVRRIFTSIVTDDEAGVIVDVLGRVRERVRADRQGLPEASPVPPGSR